MKSRVLLVAVAGIVAVTMAGCGDPAPSTALAPDQAKPDPNAGPPADLAKIKASQQTPARH